MNISPTLGLWLLSDDYDSSDDPRTISATALLKPVKAIVLSRRVVDKAPVSIDSLIASRMGSAVHTAIENSWLQGSKTYEALSRMGLPAHRYLINPEGSVPEGMIPIYLEQRFYRKLNGWTVTGKFDMVFDGQVHDIKTTKAYNIEKKLSHESWKLQGSIYRWLTPEVITDESLLVEAVIVDWNRGSAARSADYPQSAWQRISLPLLTVSNTESYISNKLELLDMYMDSDESEMPRCTDEELWRDAPKYAYYAKGITAGRSTRNFDTLLEAQTYQVSKGGKGEIEVRKGSPKACDYCPAALICKQRLEYLND